MLPGPHLIAGAAIATKLGSFSWPTIVLALLSHVILDAIPHADTVEADNPFNKLQIIIIIVDLIIAVSIIYIFFRDNLALACFGAFWGLSPDFIDQSKLIFPAIKQNKYWKIFHHYHALIQSIKPSWFVGILTQVVAVILILIWVYYF